MIALLQRVTRAEVTVESRSVGRIDGGLLALVCAERGDGTGQAERLLGRILDCRVFADEAGRMNRSVRDVGGGLMLVPQFTLAADTSKGNRPRFTPAAAPDEARRLFEHILLEARRLHPVVAAGQFGARMAVSLTNDGPVTLWLQVPAGRPPDGAEASRAVPGNDMGV
jgi:D-tyrosyl-tRNA(Tyr) deacylase